MVPTRSRQVAERGYNSLGARPVRNVTGNNRRAGRLVQERKSRNAAAQFDPLEVGVARAFYVAKDKADKEASARAAAGGATPLRGALEAADGTQSKASIMAFSDTREASEEAARSTARRTRLRSSSRSCKSSASNMCCSTVAVWRTKACGASPRELMPAFADGSPCMREVG